jgi:hypothetical protein
LRLSELSQTVIDYCTFGMEGTEEPFKASLVKRLVIEDDGEQIALEYHGPKRRPEPKPLGKALGKVSLGAIAAKLANRTEQDPQQRRRVTDGAAGMSTRWSESDVREAFAPRRGEGYYRVDGRRERYYTGIIHE